MNKVPLLLLSVILYLGVFSVNAQQIIYNASHIYRNIDGTEISYKRMKELLSDPNNLYRVNRDTLQDGKIALQLQPVPKGNKVKARKGTRKGNRFPSVNMKDMQGRKVTDETLAGKVTVINFWFTGCPPCIEEIPELNELTEKYKDRVNFIAPTFDDKGKVKKFLAKHPFTYTITPAALPLIRELRVMNFPTHIVLDQQGIIQKVIVGGFPGVEQALSSIIDDHL